MKVALFQMDLVWESPRVNLDKVCRWMDSQARDADLIVLPEMFSTGFTLAPAGVAEEMSGTTVRALLELATRFKKAITGSIVVREEANDGIRYFNRLLFVMPDGTIHSYDKRHLFRMAGEQNIYTAGSERLVVEYMGLRICPLVCYDLRFPVWSRNRGDYDVLIYVADWAAPRREAWQILLKARAIENQCYVLGCNRVGEDPDGTAYAGDSAVVDFKGVSSTAAEPYCEEVVLASVDREELDRFRRKFPAYMDADDFRLL